MTELKIELREDRAMFEPGEELTGSVSWTFDNPPRFIELRLFWFTRGKGTEDVGVMETSKFEQPLAAEQRAFKFRLPTTPYSFSGKLISLVWALELIAYPSKEVVRREIVVGPGGQEVMLDSIARGDLKPGGISITIR